VNTPLQKEQFDFIGDIHGHAEKLVALLELLGYTEQKDWILSSIEKSIFCG
jgi:hypothetical protein